MGGKPRNTELLPGVYPVRGWKNYQPKESDGFQRPGEGAKRKGKGHLGHDIMFRRPAKGPEQRPEYVKWYFCPSDCVEAVAVAKGVIGIVKYSTRNGWWVTVKHGRFVSVYRHLKDVAVKAGDVVGPGDFLGFVSFAPKAGANGINHLHYELWDMLRPGPAKRAYKIIDASRYLRRWKKLPPRVPATSLPS